MLIFNNNTETLAQAMRFAASLHGDSGGHVYNKAFLQNYAIAAWDLLAGKLIENSIEDILRVLDIQLLGSSIVAPNTYHTVGPTGSGATTEDAALLNVRVIHKPVVEIVTGWEQEVEPVDMRGNVLRIYGRSDDMLLRLTTSYKLILPAYDAPLGIENAFAYMGYAMAASLGDGTVSDVNKMAAGKAAEALDSIIAMGLKAEGIITPSTYTALDEEAYMAGEAGDGYASPYNGNFMGYRPGRR